jgi:membrane protease YdiL (CAAX protease family)
VSGTGESGQAVTEGSALQTRSPLPQPLRAFFVLAFGITWGVGGLALLASALGVGIPLSTSNPLYYLAAYGPTIAGVVVTGRLGGWPAVRRLLARLLPSRTGLPWYAAVIVGFPAVLMFVSAVAFTYALPDRALWSQLPALLALTLVTDPGPLGEEVGWRGFALPDMLRRRSPLVSALVLGLIWAAWHLPTFFISTLSQSRISFPMFVLNIVALSVLMTWLYLRSGGDLLLMILVHLMASFSVGVLGVPFAGAATGEVLIAGLILIGGGLRVAPQDRRAS